MKPDPAKSFWKDEMVSPFPVKYAKVKDRRGVEWEIGYFDEYCGKDKNPPVLVVVHGKGAFAAHYGYLIKYAVERGYRVIAPDMPQWGTSGPGNLDKPMTRTLDDVRDAFHALIVGKLGVKKAFYHGHSLGGADRARLRAALSGRGARPDPRRPGGARGVSEEHQARRQGAAAVRQVLRLRPQALGGGLRADRHDGRREASAPSRACATSSTSSSAIRRPDAVTPSYNGYFKVDTEYARLHTDQRIAMISGNKRELDQWVFMFIYDLYSICSEVAADDPASMYKQLPKIKAPIFVAFGAQEPFIPGTALNGLKDLGNDIINPFMKRMTAAGNKPVLKVYPGVGHFIHTDVPYEFARDTVDFMRSGRVDAVSPEVGRHADQGRAGWRRRRRRRRQAHRTGQVRGTP